MRWRRDGSLDGSFDGSLSLGRRATEEVVQTVGLVRGREGTGQRETCLRHAGHEGRARWPDTMTSCSKAHQRLCTKTSRTHARTRSCCFMADACHTVTMETNNRGQSGACMLTPLHLDDSAYWHQSTSWQRTHDDPLTHSLTHSPLTHSLTYHPLTHHPLIKPLHYPDVALDAAKTASRPSSA